MVRDVYGTCKRIGRGGSPAIASDTFLRLSGQDGIYRVYMGVKHSTCPLPTFLDA